MEKKSLYWWLIFILLSIWQLPQLIVALIIGATYFSFKNMNTSGNEEQAKQMKMMSTFMVVFISVVSFSLPTSIALYWIVSNGFTVIQNLILKKGKL